MASGIFKMGSSLGSAFGVAIYLSVYAAVTASTNNLHQAANTAIMIGVPSALLAALVSFLLVPARRN